MNENSSDGVSRPESMPIPLPPKRSRPGRSAGFRLVVGNSPDDIDVKYAPGSGGSSSAKKEGIHGDYATSSWLERRLAEMDAVKEVRGVVSKKDDVPTQESAEEKPSLHIIKEVGSSQAAENFAARNQRIAGAEDMEKVEKSISAAKNFEELYDVLRSLGGLHGSEGFISASPLIDRIDDVRASAKPLQWVTRTGGLRKKVDELMNPVPTNEQNEVIKPEVGGSVVPVVEIPNKESLLEERAGIENKIVELRARLNRLNEMVQRAEGLAVRAKGEAGPASRAEDGDVTETMNSRVARIEDELRQLENSLRRGRVEVGSDVVPPIPAPENPIPPGSGPERKEEKKLPPGTGKRMEDGFNKESGKQSMWGWLKERAKGFITFGGLEFWHAEKFRRGTKKTSKEIASRAERGVQQVGSAARDAEFARIKILQAQYEKEGMSPKEARDAAMKSGKDVGGLSLEDAMEEARTMESMRKLEGKDLSGREQVEQYEGFSEAISAAKMERNAEVARGIVADAVKNIQQRLAKYKDQYGENILTEDRIKSFAGGLTADLIGMADVQRAKSARDFRKMARRAFDASYWSRYVYGAMDLAAWGFTGYHYVLPAVKSYFGAGSPGPGIGQVPGVESISGKGVLASKEISGIVNLPPGVESSLSSATPMPSGWESFLGQYGPQGMDGSIWNTCSEFMKAHGVSNPSNSEIFRFAKSIAETNGIGVDKWNLIGNPMDTNMLQGHLLKGFNTIPGSGAMSIADAAVTAAKMARGII